MYCNGYAYFNVDAFHNKTDKVCYIPENAESPKDYFTYNDLLNEVIDWRKDNEDYFEFHHTTTEAVLEGMYENIEWSFPSTYLESLNNY